jgi:hypothetical protein
LGRINHNFGKQTLQVACELLSYRHKQWYSSGRQVFVNVQKTFSGVNRSRGQCFLCFADANLLLMHIACAEMASRTPYFRCWPLQRACSANSQCSKLFEQSAQQCQCQRVSTTFSLNTRHISCCIAAARVSYYITANTTHCMQHCQMLHVSKTTSKSERALMVRARRYHCTAAAYLCRSSLSSCSLTQGSAAAVAAAVALPPANRSNAAVALLAGCTLLLLLCDCCAAAAASMCLRAVSSDAPVGESPAVTVAASYKL